MFVVCNTTVCVIQNLFYNDVQFSDDFIENEQNLFIKITNENTFDIFVTHKSSERVSETQREKDCECKRALKWSER